MTSSPETPNVLRKYQNISFLRKFSGILFATKSFKNKIYEQCFMNNQKKKLYSLILRNKKKI